jgi:hypothetical protein
MGKVRRDCGRLEKATLPNLVIGRGIRRDDEEMERRLKMRTLQNLNTCDPNGQSSISSVSRRGLPFVDFSAVGSAGRSYRTPGKNTISADPLAFAGKASVRRGALLNSTIVAMRGPPIHGDHSVHAAPPS